MNLQLNWGSTHKALGCKFMLHMVHKADSQKFSEKYKGITNQPTNQQTLVTIFFKLREEVETQCQPS